MLSVLNICPNFGLLDCLERGKNNAIKYGTKIFAPVKPFNLSVKIGNKGIALINLLVVEKILPALSRSMEGAGDILGVGAFVSLIIVLFPNLAKDNLDEAKLRQSLAQNDKLGVDAIVAQVKKTIEKTCHSNDIREAVFTFLVEREMDEQFARKIAHCDMVVVQQKKPFIENFITYAALVSATNGLVINLTKLGANFVHVTMWIGKTRVGAFVVQIGFRRIALVATLAGAITKLGHQSHKAYGLHGEISALKGRIKAEGDKDQRDKLEVELESLTTKKTKAVWAAGIAGMRFVLNGVTLVVTVNPIIMTGYELFILSCELTEAISF